MLVHAVALTEVLAGNASAINVVTGQAQTLNLQDPDSMILDPNGELVFTSQADMEIVVIEQDAESRIHLALVLDDDPGKDLGFMRQPGHRFFYTLDEVEPVSEIK